MAGAVLTLTAWALHAGDADRLHKEARKAEKAGEIARAYALYAQAAALDPSNKEYWARSQALRTQALLEAKASPVLGPVDTEIPESFEPLEPSIVPEDEIEKARQALPPPELKRRPGRQDFDLRGDAKTLWNEVAQRFGLDTVFDGDYQPGPTVRFRLERADFQDTVRALEAATGSFIVPLGERLFMIFKDTPQKRTENEPTVAVVVPVPHPVTVQEAQELVRTVQQTMEIQRFVFDSGRRLALIRDRVSKVRAAQRIFEQLLYHRAQIVVDVEFLDVAAASSVRYGIDLQTSFPLVYLSRIWNHTPVFPEGFAAFLTFGGGATLFGIGIADAELFASMTESSGKTILKAELRSTDGQPATMHIGDRYPILTGAYFGDLGQNDGLYRPPPTVSFEDLGLSLKITPRVHSLEEVTLEVEAEFKVLAGVSVNTIPVITNRKFQSRVRLRTSEWAIMAGIMTSDEARAIEGLAGLSSVPVLGPLFRSNNKSKQNREALLVLKPRLLSLPSSEIVTEPFYIGTETRPVRPL